MATKTLNVSNLITVISLSILVGTEVFGVALASGWAIAGLFELGATISYVLMAIFSAVQAFLTSMIVGAVLFGDFKLGSSPFLLLRESMPDLLKYNLKTLSLK